MAWLSKRGKVFHLGFRYSGVVFRTSLKTADKRTADAAVARVDENIRLVETGRLSLPADASDVPTFFLSDGKLAGKPKLSPVGEGRLSGVCDAYVTAMANGSMEENTLGTVRTHIKHLQGILGASVSLKSLAFEQLQRYVDTRAKQKGQREKKLSTVTIKKELATLRAIWTWAVKRGVVNHGYPGEGLRFPKSEEKPRFQTWQEIEYQIGRGGLDKDEQDELWECLFLAFSEITELLNSMSQRARHQFIHPMVATAAYTGARRSELVRAQFRDFDLKVGTVTLREKKRDRQKYTTRTVPIAKGLNEVLALWFDNHPGGKHAFCISPRPLTVNQAHDHFKRTISGTKWDRIRGWHVLRHSFASNCAAKGVDQRLINAWMGHQTEEMMKRYQHLFPDTQQQAIQSVFDGQ